MREKDYLGKRYRTLIRLETKVVNNNIATRLKYLELKMDNSVC